MKQRTILALAFGMMLVITVVTVIVVSVVFPNLQYLLRLVVPDATPTPVATAVPTPSPTPSPTPAPFITGTAAYVIDADTGRVLYSLHSSQPLPIASTTKIMTVIVAMENANLDQGVIVQQSDLDQVPPDASTAGLVVGDYFRLRTLLYALLLPSGTDAALVIARAVAGSAAQFVALMNRKAQLLHLTHTHFSSPHGYSGVDHYASAADLVTLATYAMRNPLFADIVAQVAYTVRLSQYTHAYQWENTNALLTTYQGADGVKTGWTDAAGVCLVFSARRQGHHLIAAGVCLMALVIGSIVMVFYTSRQQTPGPAPVGTSHSTAAARPTLVAYHPGKSLGNLVYSTTVNDSGVNGLAWSPDSTRLGVATSSAQSWVATTGKDVVNYDLPSNGGMSNVRAVVWSPDGKLVAVTEGQGVQLYNASTGVLWKTYPDNGPAATVTTTSGYLSAQVTLSGGSGAGATAWSPDGQLMATAFFDTTGQSSYGQSVQVWNISTGKLVQNYTGNVYNVESLSWSPVGTYVASSNVEGNTQVWNALTGQIIYDFEGNANTSCAEDVAWSPDGQTLAYLSCDQVRVVNPFTGQLLRTHTGPHDSQGLSALAWSPDGKYVASAGDHIEMWSVATGRTYYTFTQNASPIRVLVWSPNGKYIASANWASTVPVTLQVWSAE